MVRKPAADFHVGAQGAQGVFKTFRTCDAAEARHPFPPEGLQRKAFPREHIFQIPGAVVAHDDVRHGIVLPDGGDQLILWLSAAFGQNDVTGARQTAPGFPQGAAREHGSGAKGRAAIHQHDIQFMRQFQILHAVVQQQGVAPQVLNGEDAGLDAVFIHQHRHAVQIFGEHERFISGMQGAQVARFPVAGDFGKIFRQPAVLVSPFLRLIQLCAFVAACQDGYFTAAEGEGAGQQFHHRGFSGSSHGDVAHADHQHSQPGLPGDAGMKQIQPCQNHQPEQPGGTAQDHAHHGGAESLGTAEDDFRPPLFKFFRSGFHGKPGGVPGNSFSGGCGGSCRSKRSRGRPALSCGRCP